MSSWFSAASFSDAWKQVNETVQQVNEKVQSSMPDLVVDQAEILKKLTLDSPELKEERTRLEAEEYRKETVKEYLSELLPWETRNEENDILVQECKEAIMELPLKEHSFTMPFSLPDKITMFVPFEVVHDENDPQKEEQEETDPQTLKSKAAQNLQKIEPLPPLLQHFDLDVHVGLIERVLKEDENLRDIHACLAGAGEREHAFWHNYFIHCAFIRHSVGLSIDEIWGTKPLPVSLEEAHEEIKNLQNKPIDDHDDNASQEVTFEPSSPPTVNSNSHVMESRTTPEKNKIIQDSIQKLNDSTTHSESDIGTDYEVIQSQEPLNEDELDDLEAEILRELED